jgi:SET domain-containing protein
MLTVKTVLRETRTKGIGLFAAEPIAAGSVWWKDDRTFNRLISDAELSHLPDIARHFVFTYGALTGTGQWYVCLDNARFVNHSESPNTAPLSRARPAYSGDWIAVRDISVGEEITSDYRHFCATCQGGLPFRNAE